MIQVDFSCTTNPITIVSWQSGLSEREITILIKNSTADCSNVANVNEAPQEESSINETNVSQ